MTARTMFSDKQELLVARVLNNSMRDKRLSANSFLSVAEPVQCLSGHESSHTSGVVFAEPVYPCGSRLLDESILSAKPSCLSAMVTTDAADASAPSAAATTAKTPAADSSSPSSEAQSDHIDGLLCSLPVELTSEQKDRAEQLIRSYAHVFSRSEYDIGRMSIIPHRIDTGENSPHFEQLRRHPTTQLPVIDEHVSHMLEHDVIEPAASPWCSNVVMVRKQDGTMRLCVDYRKLNCLTVKDKFLLPKIDTCLDTLNGCEFL